MREIKFRAWIKTESKMVPVTFPDSIGFGCDGEFHIDSGFAEHYWDLYYEEDAYKLMQYTGLKDKNGVEIYEGDILTYSPKGYYHHTKRKDVIKWDSGLGKWHFGYGGGSSTRKHSYNFKGVTDIEVIGNIYENPELLDERD